MESILSVCPGRNLNASLRKVLFPSGRMQCPQCRSYRVQRSEGRYRCPKCRVKWSIQSLTWMKGAKIPLQQIALLVRLWHKGYATRKASEMLGLSRPTVYRWYQRFRAHVVQTIDFVAENSVQVDEAYFGSFRKRANVYHSQRTYERAPKVGVFGIVCPTTGRLFTTLMGTRPFQVIKRSLKKHVPPSVAVFSDKSPYYTHLRTTHVHMAETHDFSFAFSQAIESVWGWMKRTLFTQYHHFTRRYARAYVRELTWRYNTLRSSQSAWDYLLLSLTPVPTR